MRSFERIARERGRESMIAGCPKCSARYRVDLEQIGEHGAKLRCTKCSAVFLVRAPRAPRPIAPVPIRQIPTIAILPAASIARADGAGDNQPAGVCFALVGAARRV